MALVTELGCLWVPACQEQGRGQRDRQSHAFLGAEGVGRQTVSWVWAHAIARSN